MAGSREYHRRYYKKRRKKIIEYLGGACAVCGSTKELQVDHVDPAEKNFNISQRLTLDNILEELAKCQLLCRKHHQEKTARENEGFTHGTSYAWMKKGCTCLVCTEAKHAHYDERNAKRREGEGYSKQRGVDPQRHGTRYRYKLGCRCPACRAAQAAWMREYRKRC